MNRFLRKERDKVATEILDLIPGNDRYLAINLLQQFESVVIENADENLPRVDLNYLEQEVRGSIKALPCSDFHLLKDFYKFLQKFLIYHPSQRK